LPRVGGIGGCCLGSPLQFIAQMHHDAAHPETNRGQAGRFRGGGPDAGRRAAVRPLRRVDARRHWGRSDRRNGGRGAGQVRGGGGKRAHHARGWEGRSGALHEKRLGFAFQGAEAFRLQFSGEG
jgi:hypothetical protein